MTNETDFEIPSALRDLAQTSIEQARGAYSQFLDANQRAQAMVAQSSEAMGTSVREIQKKIMEYAEANTRAGFDHAGRLAKAKSVQEAVDMQANFARKQMEAYTQQASELSRLMAKAGG